MASASVGAPILFANLNVRRPRSGHPWQFADRVLNVLPAASRCFVSDLRYSVLLAALPRKLRLAHPCAPEGRSEWHPGQRSFLCKASICRQYRGPWWQELWLALGTIWS